MSVIAGLQDFRQEGPPADIGIFQFPSLVLVFEHVFSGTTYYCAARAGSRGWVLVDFGTDLCVALQSAVTAVQNAGGGVVSIARMTAGNLTATISVTASNITIEGAGMATSLTWSANVKAISVTGTAATHIENVVIRNLFLHGTDAGAAADGIYLNYVEHAEIFKVKTEDFGGSGINFATALSNVVLDCYIYHCEGQGIALDINSLYNRVVSCVLTYAYWNNIIDAGFNNVYIGNEITQARNGYGFSSNASDATVVGNRTSMNFAGGIRVAYCSVITGNLVNHEKGHGIIAVVDNNTVCGNHLNHFEASNIAGIYCTGNNCTISGNTIWDLDLGGSYANNDGILLSGADYTDVVGNTCTLNVRDGIRLANCTYINIVGNVCRANAYGINLTTACDYSSIRDNLTTGNATGSCNVGDAACDNNVITNNSFDEGNISNAGTNTRAWLNYDPSANAFIATINPPVDSGLDTLP